MQRREDAEKAKLKRLFADNRLSSQAPWLCTPVPSLLHLTAKAKRTSFETAQQELFQSFEALKRCLQAKTPDRVKLAECFASFAAQFLIHSEMSLSVPGLDPLSKGSGDGHLGRLCQKLTKLYGAQHARLCFNGTSGSLWTALAALLVRLQPNRRIVLVDEMAHSSAYGGLLHGQWQYATFPRRKNTALGMSEPVRADDVIKLAEKLGVEKISAILAVSPDYNGMRSKSEIDKLIAFAKFNGITVIIDAAWGSLIGDLPLDVDIVVTSPHKKGIAVSSHGAFFTNNEDIAELFDEAIGNGLGTTSPSYIALAATEHVIDLLTPERLLEVREANLACRHRVIATLAEHVPQLQPVQPSDLDADDGDPAHLLLKLPPWLNGWRLQEHLSQHFTLHAEMADEGSILFLLSPSLTKADISFLTNALAQSHSELREAG